MTSLNREVETAASSDEGSEADTAPELLDVETPLASRLLAAFESFGRGELLGVALLLSGVPFVVSLAIAVSQGFGSQFLRTSAVYLWIAGLFGGGLTFGWWGKRYPELWVTLRAVFDVPDSEYRAVVGPRLARIYDLKRAMVWLPGVLMIGGIYDLVVSGAPYIIYVPEAMILMQLPSGVLLGWLDVINFIFAIVSLIGIMIAIHIVVGHIRLVSDVMSLPLRDIQTASAELMPLARFNIIISAGWFLSLTFGMLLLLMGGSEVQSDPFFVISFMLVFLFGVVLFAAPQYSIHTGLLSAKRDLLETINTEYDRLYAAVSGTADTADPVGDVSVQLDVLEARRRNAKEIPTWAYDLPGVASLLLSSVIPLLLQFGDVFG